MTKEEHDKRAALIKFAAKLLDGDPNLPREQQRRLPWHLKTTNGQPRHRGALVKLLEKAGIDATRWTPKTFLDTLDHYRATRKSGWDDLWSNANNPLGYLKTLITNAINPTDLTPLEQRAAEARIRQAEQAERARARQAEAERLANTDHDEIQRIIAAMHAKYPRTRK